MTRKQAALIIGVNALISTLISVVVALVIVRPAQITLSPSPPAGAVVTQPVVVEASSTAEPVVHIVQTGDTISGLALKYNVSEEDIIAANQLQNPNFLQLGMELIIPIGGLLQVTPTWTPAPTPTDTPIPFEPPSAEMTVTADTQAGATDIAPATPPVSGELRVEISEILGVGQVDQEQVTISNLGDQLADMQGWTLSDAEGNIFTYPNFRLWGAGNTLVHTRIGQDGSPPANFYWGKLEAIWSLGEMATLRDAEGNVVSTYIVGP